MFSKLILASSAFLGADAIRLRNNARLHQVEQVCGANLARQANSLANASFESYTGGSQLYEDPEFTADESSLFWRDFLRDDMAQNYIDLGINTRDWMRPTELVDGSPSMWGDLGILPTGIDQGMLGDCWFLASTAALAENPERIRKLFTNTDYDSAGIFQVKLYNQGEVVKVTVDDRLPITNGKEGYVGWNVKAPANAAMSTNNAWWFAILEKAYSKFNVNYAQLNGGLSGVALRQLTGMPVMTYDSKDQSEAEFYAIVHAADLKEYAMSAGCDVEYGGLQTSHAYSLLDAFQLVDGGPTVVKMRNPWSSENYDGPYSDSSDLWTAAQKEQVGLVVADDGVFFMPVSGFKKAFNTYAIVAYNEDYHQEKITVTGTGKTFMRYFKSAVDQDVFITFEYQNKRAVEKGCARDEPFFNYYIDNANDPQVVSKQTSYGSYQMALKAGESHSLETYNWGDITIDVHFVLQTYAESGPVIWSETAF